MSDAPAPQTIVSSGMPWSRARARTRARLSYRGRRRFEKAPCKLRRRRAARACRIHVHREVNEVGGTPSQAMPSDCALPPCVRARRIPRQPGARRGLPHAIAPTASTTAARGAEDDERAYGRSEHEPCRPGDVAPLDFAGRVAYRRFLNKLAKIQRGSCQAQPERARARRLGLRRVRARMATPVAAPDARSPARVEPDDRAHGDHEQSR